MSSRMRGLILVVGLLSPFLATADEAQDKEAVIATVQAFFDAMTARDVERMRTLMTADGIIYGYLENEDGLQVIRPTHADYLENLAAGQARLVERFWDPEVMVHGRLATIWTPYELYADGQFSHCGVNNFSMLKMATGWVITGVVFSIEGECAPSPLGPFEAR